jgi:hypothetical protein
VAALSLTPSPLPLGEGLNSLLPEGEGPGDEGERLHKATLTSESKLKDFFTKVAALNDRELMRFREWFSDFDASTWDRQPEHDVAAGKLDTVAERALAAYRSGQSKPL